MKGAVMPNSALEPGPAYVRSTFVTVLAWIFIILAGFATLISILQNIMVALVFPAAEMQAAAERDRMPWFASFMFTHVHLFFLLFLAVSASTLAAAIGLLKRMNWARVLFIAMMVLGIVWNLAGLAFMVFFVSSMTGMPLPTKQASAAQHFDVMWKIMVGFNVLMVIAFTWLYGWIIKRLASEEIRLEFSAIPR
jgi:hypothetical protein